MLKKSFLIILIAIVCFIKCGVKADFDQTLGTVSRTGSDQGEYNQSYKYSSNGYTVFCTAYNYNFGSNCSLSNGWSDALRAGVGYIIKQANFQSVPLSGGVTQTTIHHSTQITLAINALIHEKEDKTSSAYLVKFYYPARTVEPRTLLDSAYVNILNNAEQEYDRVKGEHDVIITRIGNGKYYYNPSGGYNHPQFKFHIQNLNLDKSSFVLTLGKAGAYLPENVSIKISYYSDSSFVNLITTETLTGEINDKINTDTSIKNLDDYYIKVELIDNRTNPNEIIENQIHLTVSGKNSLEYDEARNYYCQGQRSQNFTPNKTESVLKRYHDSAVADIYSVETPEFPDLEIVKVDKKNSNVKLSGAKLGIYKNNASDPTKILTTDSEGKTTYGDLEIDKNNDNFVTTKYCVKEIKAPDKYYLNTQSYCFNIEMVTQNTSNTIKVTKLNNSDPIVYDANANDNKGLITITIPDDENELKIKKINEEEESVSGVTLTLTKEGETVPIRTWTTVSNSNPDNDFERFVGLDKGTYYVSETEVPDGYILTTKSKSIVINGTETEPILVYFKNYKTNIQIAKIDENKQRLSGARLQIIDENNNIVFGPWESKNNEDKVIEGVLGINKIYYLEEISAPNGYSIKPKIKFQLDDNGNVIILDGAKQESEDKITLTNDKNTVKVKKTDVITNEVLSGAHLQLLDNEGKIIKLKKNSNNNHLLYPDENGDEFWITDEEEFTIEKIPSGTYAIHEIHAPEGYKLNKTDVVFKVENDGTVTLNGHVSQNKVVIYKNEKNSLTISKTDITGSKEVPGAQLQIINKNTNKIIKFKKVNGILEPDENGDEFWTSSDKPQSIRMLKAGTYILKEILAPEGYVLSTEEIEFTLDNQGNIKVNNKLQDSNTLIMTNDNVRVYISKQDITTKEELPGATLILKNENGDEIEKWVSDIEPHLIIGLVPGTYTLTEISAPEGYQLSEETITFTIDKNGALSGNTILYNTPIPEVPNTLSTQSIIITLLGLFIV